MKKLIAAALVALPLIFAPPALANSTDDEFLAEMHGHGLTAKGGDGEFIQLAYSICLALQDNSEQTLEDKLAPYANNGLARSDVVFIVQTSEKYYCPRGSGATV